VLSLQAQLQHDLASSPEDDAGDHDTSNLFEGGHDIGQEDTQERADSDGQNSDNYDTAVEGVEGVLGVEEAEHEGSGSDEDEDDDGASTSVEDNEESQHEDMQPGSQPLQKQADQLRRRTFRAP